MRPAWWREFLQKVKMFFYGFKGFSNYRFTDKEIETLLLRGYRKTRNARGAKAEGGDARFAALRREGAPNTAFKPGQLRDSRVPHEEGFMEKYKFSGKGLYADYEFLYGRHPEYFEDAEHVRAAVEFVLAQPEEAGNIRDNLAFVREDQSTGKVYRVEINPKIIGKRCQIRSVHEITQTQYKKIKDRTARGDSASPDSVRHEQEFKASEHPNMKTSDPSEKATVVDFLRYDSTESGKVKHSPEGGARFSIDEEGKPLFNVQGYGEQKLESILQDKSISAKTQILTDDGSPDWGRVTPEMIANAPADLNLKALPIRLFKGDYGYGLVHLSKHLKDFTGRDLSNVILNVFGKPNKIYARRDGDAIKLEVFPKPPSQWGILELREEQGCYSVVTFYPRDNAHSKPKGEMIWRFGSQTETSQAASDQSRNGATGETPQVTQEETTVQTSHNINPFDIKVKYALEDGSDFSDGADKYTLENAKASKEGYRVERVNEKAKRYSAGSKNPGGIPSGVVHTIHDEGFPVKGEFKKQTETLQFKEWFGKSKVVDEEGKPLVVYHGSTADFTEFSYKFANRNGQADGRGFYFTGNRSFAEGYQNKDGKLFEVYLSIQKPLNPDKLTITKAELRKILDAIDPSGDYMTNYAEDDRGYPGAAWRAKALNSTVNAIYDSSENNADILAELYGSFGGGEVLAEVRKVSGYDGFIKKDQNGNMIYIAFEPGQIKSATDNIGTYDRNNPDIRFSIEQYSDADWSDMVTYMRSKVGDVLNHPDSDYRRMLEEAGMRCYSEADAHACAVEAMQQNEREIRERGKQRRDKWIYENELLYRLVVDFAGSDKFTLVPDSFTGEKFTGTWIAEEYRKYSEKRAQKPAESDRQYKRYLETREKALARAKGYRLDEVAEAVARKTGRDTLEVQEELVDYQNLKEGTSWGREGAARRLAAMTLDSIERV